MRQVAGSALAAGARNLLDECAGVRPGLRVVVLQEDPELGWYDREAPAAVARMARELGAEVEVLDVGDPGTSLPDDLAGALQRSDIEIWFARIGDQDRFQTRASKRVKVVSYARTAAALASGFGTRAHSDMVALKDQVDAKLAAAKTIHITCPLGTDLTGTDAPENAEDVTVRRFPMCVPRPVSARNFSGHVALSGHLTPTGSRSYEPANLPLPDIVLAEVEKGRIVGFQGAPQTIEDIRAHYARVARLFGIEWDVVHSWHAGIHSGCFHEEPVHENPDLWSNTIFGSPQWLHFHTCGDYAPGEICWMVQNPTILADDHALWSEGVLRP
ncbi:MAG: hypothetical protein AAF557_09360 [Pseudomonadota bacterium]